LTYYTLFDTIEAITLCIEAPLLGLDSAQRV